MGTRKKKPEFQRMLADCRTGKIDVILVKSISRFARNTVTLLETVCELKALGIGVIFEEQNMNTLSGDGELMLSILASVFFGRRAAAFPKTASGASGKNLSREYRPG